MRETETETERWGARKADWFTERQRERHRETAGDEERRRRRGRRKEMGGGVASDEVNKCCLKSLAPLGALKGF